MKKRLKELYDMEEDRTELDLDLFRDVPAAYAVFQVIPDEEGSGAMDARYVYVNQLYCTIAGCTPEDLLGHRFYEVYPQGNPLWMECCHRAVTEQKEIHGSLYEGAVSHWLDFSMKFLEDHPGWVAFVFMIADREREERCHAPRDDDRRCDPPDLADPQRGGRVPGLHGPYSGSPGRRDPPGPAVYTGNRRENCLQHL